MVTQAAQYGIGAPGAVRRTVWHAGVLGDEDIWSVAESSFRAVVGAIGPGWP